MEFSSSAVKWRFQHANGIINLSRLLAPISTEVTASWRNTQASAICDSFWPRPSRQPVELTHFF